MQDFLLLTVVAAAAVYGQFLMKRLDRFLEDCQQARNLEIRNLQSDYGNDERDIV